MLHSYVRVQIIIKASDTNMWTFQTLKQFNRIGILVYVVNFVYVVFYL